MVFARYMGQFCDQIYKQFLLIILKLLITKPKVTYLIPFHKVTLHQSSHIYNMNIFTTGSLYFLIILLSKTCVDRWI